MKRTIGENIDKPENKNKAHKVYKKQNRVFILYAEHNMKFNDAHLYHKEIIFYTNY